MEVKEKIVDFTWCQRCVHWEKKEDEDPCDECLDYPSNEDSRRPTKFKDKGE